MNKLVSILNAILEIEDLDTCSVEIHLLPDLFTREYLVWKILIEDCKSKITMTEETLSMTNDQD